MEIDKTEIPVAPKRPMGRRIAEGTAGDCPKCKSTTIKKFYFFGRSIGCIQPECDNYAGNNE